MIKVDIGKTLPGFALNAAFDSGAGVTALFGRSGSGKTTLVNCIAGLVRPDSGCIEINGDCLFDSARGIDLPVEKRRLGYVFQEGRLFPHLTVRGNLDYGRALTPAGERRIDFAQIVQLLGLESLLERRPAHLSGGEKQRVAIGRALLASPRLLLMDEPLAALDQARKGEILGYIERLHREISIPIVYVTHAVDEILRLAETVVLMANGGVVASGAVAEIMGRPELRARGGIFEGGAVVEATVAARDEEFELATLAFDGGRLVTSGIEAVVGERVRLRVRARDVSLALVKPADVSVLNVLPARIVDISAANGASVMVRLMVGNTAFAARVTRYSANRLGLAAGREVYAMIKAVSLA